MDKSKGSSPEGGEQNEHSFNAYYADGAEQDDVPKSYHKEPQDSVNDENLDQIHELARQITSLSVKSGDGRDHINPFIDSEDPALDPNSGKFSPRAWFKHMVNISKRDENRPPPLTSGVAFKNLGAYGYGSGADYQKTVGNIMLEAYTLAKKLSGMEKKSRIQILQNFDGLLNCGEMCIVLGRPGR